MTKPSFNPAMLCDFYEYTMTDGYLAEGYGDKILYFDVFFRSVPDEGGFAIAAGLEQAVEYIQNLHFDERDIEFFKRKGEFSDEFLDELRNYKFTGDIWAVPEGTPIFPNEPMLTVRARAAEAQIIETYLLLCLNHQSLIATKANRIVRAAAGRAVSEFGARRAQGAQGAYLGARAAYIAGCAGSSNTLSDQLFGVPASGTMAHSWVQVFESEYQSFEAYCRRYPDNPTLLVDTYNVLKSGVPNAIRAFEAVLKPLGKTRCSIRIDSGDIAYLSRRAREQLDAAGWPQCKIVASNSLDENIIRDIILQGGQVDVFGVGERLITAKSDPVFGGVYKLVAVEDAAGNVVPKIKVSENVTKITTPHFKKLYRLYSNDSGKAEADLICVYDETIDESRPLEIFDPDFTWKRKTLEDFTARELMVPVFKGGELVYELPDIESIRSYCAREVGRIWDEVKRFENPHGYYVDLSQKLWDIKQQLLEENQ